VRANRCRLALYSSQWAADSAREHKSVDPREVHAVPTRRARLRRAVARRGRGGDRQPGSGTVRPAVHRRGLGTKGRRRRRFRGGGIESGGNAHGSSGRRLRSITSTADVRPGSRLHPDERGRGSAAACFPLRSRPASSSGPARLKRSGSPSRRPAACHRGLLPAAVWSVRPPLLSAFGRARRRDARRCSAPGTPRAPRPRSREWRAPAATTATGTGARA